MIHNSVPIEVSARHIHLSAKHLAKLFGKSYKLKVYRQISQPGQFAAREFVTIVGKRGKIKVRVVGPTRKNTQVELTITDCRQLGLEPILSVSGNLKGSSGCILRGPAGNVNLKRGVIVAQRHLHISPIQARKYHLKHGDLISIKTKGLRSVTWHNVYVQSRAKIDELSFMLDTDEANAAGLTGGEQGVIINK